MILNLIGFESGSLLELVSNNATLATNIKRTGNYSMKMTQYGNYGEVGLANGTSFSGRIGVIRFYFQITSPGMMGTEEICRFHTSTNNINLRINPAMNLQLFNDTSILGTYATNLMTNTWYRIELACFPGKVVLLVNGTQALSLSTTTYNWTNLFIGSYANRNSQFLACYFDDICLTDDFFPGAGEIYNLSPTVLTGWSGSVTSLSDNNTATNITSSTANEVASITIPARDQNKVLKAIKPWVLGKDGTITLRSANREMLINNPTAFEQQTGFILIDTEPTLSIRNEQNTQTNIAEAGVAVEYGAVPSPSVFDFGLADETNSGATFINNLDPIYLQFSFKYSVNATIVDVGDYKLTVSNNNIRLMKGATVVATGATLLTANTYYTIKLILTNYASTTLYRLIINSTEELNSSHASVFTSGNVVFSNNVTVKHVCITKDRWFSNAEVVRRSPTGNGSLSNYTGSYISVAEYPISLADFVTLSTGSGGAYFSVSSVSTNIYAIKEIVVADTGFNITVFGENFTTSTSNEVLRQTNNGDSWVSLPELKIDFNGSVSSKLYGTHYLVLAEKGSSITSQTSFFLFT